MKAFERFCYRYNRYGIHNLMFYILGGNVAVFLVYLFGDSRTLGAFHFDPALVMKGQVWRVVTFLFVPPMVPTDLLQVVFFGFFVYLYYLMGRSLEDTFGCLKFTIYYFSGAVMTVILASVLGMPVDAFYLNLSIFLGFATLNPDFQLMIFMIIPVKIKYLAYLEAAVFVLLFVITPFPYNMLPVVALLNYAVYFWPYFTNFLQRKKYQAKTIPFRRTVAKAKRERGYIHKCAVCGVTDADAPGREFRYCSLCKGYKCFCDQHIYEHEHK